jgi:biotin transport system substrate-specific component
MTEAVLRKEIVVNKAACRMIGIIAFIILTSLGAFVRIPLPFTPVPVTLQTFFVLLSGLFLGNLGAVSQVSYILLGAAGMPIFSGAGNGLFYLCGPTAGYMLGFVLAALFISRFKEYAKDNFFLLFAVLCIADLILLSCGVIWLKVVFGFHLKKLLLIGFMPFLPGDLAKAAFAAAIYLKLKPRLKEVF